MTTALFITVLLAGVLTCSGLAFFMGWLVGRDFGRAESNRNWRRIIAGRGIAFTAPVAVPTHDQCPTKTIP